MSKTLKVGDKYYVEPHEEFGIVQVIADHAGNYHKALMEEQICWIGVHLPHSNLQCGIDGTAIELVTIH